jgi:hypothetical protein
VLHHLAIGELVRRRVLQREDYPDRAAAARLRRPAERAQLILPPLGARGASGFCCDSGPTTPPLASGERALV